MIKGLELTLYEVFGYLIPGGFTLIALSILAWSICEPSLPLEVITITPNIWVFVIVLSYTAGHLSQATGNIISEGLDYGVKQDWFRSKNWAKKILAHLQTVEFVILNPSSGDSLPPKLLEATSSKLNRWIIEPESSKLEGLPHQSELPISEKWLFRTCDDMVVQRGKTGNRDLYIYREGFYRGMWIAWLLLGIALIARRGRGVASIKLDKMYNINNSFMVSLLIFSFIGSLMFYFRFRRFGKYRVSNSVLAFLALTEEKKKEEKLSNDKGEN